MKTNKILIAIVILLSALYMYIDSKLIYYGENVFSFYHKLPCEITIDDVFKREITIFDKNGFSLISKYNTKYNTKYQGILEIHSKDVVSYYYQNDSALIFKVVDTEDNERLLYYYINSTTRNGFDIKLLDNNFVIDKSCYREINFEKDHDLMWKLINLRFWNGLIIFILLGIICFRLFRLRSARGSLMILKKR
jgi:hypothetical protein